MAEEVLARDARPPILYLRPFLQDGRYVERPTLGRNWNCMDWSTGRTREMVLADLFDRWGPMLAIGKPGELLPAPGAALIFSDDWKAEVLENVAKALLVVVVLGDTEGIRWELRIVSEVRDLQRVVILLPEQDGSQVSVLDTLRNEFSFLPAREPQKAQHALGTSAAFEGWFFASRDQVVSFENLAEVESSLVEVLSHGARPKCRF